MITYAVFGTGEEPFSQSHCLVHVSDRFAAHMAVFLTIKSLAVSIFTIDCVFVKFMS